MITIVEAKVEGPTINGKLHVNWSEDVEVDPPLLLSQSSIRKRDAGSNAPRPAGMPSYKRPGLWLIRYIRSLILVARLRGYLPSIQLVSIRFHLSLRRVGVCLVACLERTELLSPIVFYAYGLNLFLLRA